MTVVILLRTTEDIRWYLNKIREAAINQKTYHIDRKRIAFWHLEADKVNDSNIELFRNELENNNLALIQICGNYVFCAEEHVNVLSKIPQHEYKALCTHAA